MARPGSGRAPRRPLRAEFDTSGTSYQNPDVGLNTRREATRRPRAGIGALIGAVWVLGGWGGCGRRAPEPAPGSSPRASTQLAAAVDRPRPAKLAGEDDADAGPVLPVLTDEALAARVAAQSRFLGDHGIFEDIDGKAVPVLSHGRASGDVDDGLEMGPGMSDFDDALLDNLPGSSGIGDAEATGGHRANGNALGLYVPIEQPKRSALEHFHGALAQLKAGERDKVRVTVYGASHTQADVYQGYLRTYLQSRFGDGGHGHIAPAKINKWYRQSDFAVDDSRGWTVEHAQRRDARKDGLYGLLGASAHADSKRDRTRFYARDRSDPTSMADRYVVQFLQQPKGGKFYVYADGKKLATVDTRAEDYGPGRHEFELPLGHHEIEIRPKGNGEVRLFGLVAEKSTPGVVVDTLGIAGTRAANHLHWDEDIWRDYLQSRPPDLWMLAYGTNEATDTDQDIEVYVDRLRQVIARFQAAAPDASCVLVGPGDFPRQLDDESWVPRPRLMQIVEAQRAIAYDMGCGFWDGVAFMGGVGSMHTWATASPQMGSRDHIHLTKRGYVRMGMALTDALMVGYDAAQP